MMLPEFIFLRMMESGESEVKPGEHRKPWVGRGALGKGGEGWLFQITAPALVTLRLLEVPCYVALASRALMVHYQ